MGSPNGPASEGGVPVASGLSSRHVVRIALGVASFWTLLLGCSLGWNLYKFREHVYSEARMEARSAFAKDLVYRRWAAGHGGVYVPESAGTPPNPYLEHVPERDIETPSGRKLTLVNPAYMTRQVHDLSREQYGIRGHITSLNPLRPENAPDEWERRSLEAFHEGVDEVSSVEPIAGERYLRLMRPLVTEERCLKCHSEQGYEVGEIRGGISVSVPLEERLAEAWIPALPVVGGHTAFWLVGLVGLALGTRYGMRRARERSAFVAALEESEGFARSALNGLSAGVAVVNTEGIIESVNRKWRDSGASSPLNPSEAREGTDYIALCEGAPGLGAGEGEKFARGVRDVVAGSWHEFSMEYAVRAAEGERWFVGRVARFPGEGPARVVVSHEDITAQKRMEAVIRNAAEGLLGATGEEFFERLVRYLAETLRMEYALVGGWNAAEPGMVRTVAVFGNGGRMENFEYELRGTPCENVMGKRVCCYPDGVAEQFPEDRLLQEMGVVSYVGTPLFDSAGSPTGILAVLDSKPVADVELAKSVLQVFSVRAAAELERSGAYVALRESEERYRLLFEGMLDAFALHEIVCDEEGRPCDYVFLEVNPAFERLTGLTRESLIGRRVTEVLPHTESYWIDTFGKVALRGEPAQFENFSAALERYYEGLAFSPRKGQFACVFTDVTRRRKAEQEQRRLATIVEQASEDIIVTDGEGNITYVNPAFERITGYSREEVIGRSPRFLKSGVHDEAFYEELWLTITGGEVWTGRITNKRKDGTLVEEDAAITPIKDAEGQIVGFAAVKRDVTEQVKIEAQLQQAQKMEAIGTLAGGIAHDFNNILGAIVGYTEILADQAEGGEGVDQGYLREVLKAGERARALVKQILAFSRQGQEEKGTIQLGPIVKEALKLLRAALPTTIEIRQEMASGPDTVLGDATQFHQVVMNLCTNAMHAMRERGGVLTVRLGPVELDPEEAQQHGDLEGGEYVRITVEDTGHGMDEATQRRVFEPFFTTKEQGQGTGMGLAVVHGIVRDCGGAVDVHSRLGEGTRFDVLLPRVEGDLQAFEEERGPLPCGEARILLVDDEEALLEVGCRLLEPLGYEVVARRSATEGLETFAAEPEGFDVVVTDLTMPRMTGVELARHLLAIRPDLPVILCTGFSDAVNEEKAREYGFRELLTKPLRKRELALTLRRVLDGEET